MFENYRVFSTMLAGRKLSVETGKIAQLANGSCLVRYGDTAILATATASKAPRDGIDFLPLLKLIVHILPDGSFGGFRQHTLSRRSVYSCFHRSHPLLF